eukprot:CAMPEP_0171191806 /NCGR_PEP_ID=MMETSP0790-20130122/19550_1 /TAXON_ID=2925 /ORGANISM="Alexandrium catenella, Strain OF101" /LENGTH=71 /DNA_ID=CAMNT_0011656957 /DNA_START=8 /DNA_END=223 /DNA_ORIENTATION=-
MTGTGINEEFVRLRSLLALTSLRMTSCSLAAVRWMKATESKVTLCAPERKAAEAKRAAALMTGAAGQNVRY